MDAAEESTYTAFAGHRLIVSAGLETMLLRTKGYLEGGGDESVLIFEDGTGRQVDFDFRGTPDEVLARAAPPDVRKGPGRPRLGVVSREVSLLPRHWDWLEGQRGGISAALRRLVDEARRREPGRERARRARAAVGRVMWAIAGDFPNFEEASRALDAGDLGRFADLIGDWPGDVRRHLARLARESTLLEREGPADA